MPRLIPIDNEIPCPPTTPVTDYPLDMLKHWSPWDETKIMSTLDRGAAGAVQRQHPPIDSGQRVVLAQYERTIPFVILNDRVERARIYGNISYEGLPLLLLCRIVGKGRCQAIGSCRR